MSGFGRQIWEQVVTSTDPMHGPSLYEFIFNDTNNELSVFIDGSSLGTTSYTSPPNQQNTLTLFSNRGRGAFINGFVAEMIGVSQLSSTERQS